MSTISLYCEKLIASLVYIFPWLVHVYVPLFPCSGPRNHTHNAT